MRLFRGSILCFFSHVNLCIAQLRVAAVSRFSQNAACNALNYRHLRQKCLQ